MSLKTIREELVKLLREDPDWDKWNREHAGDKGHDPMHKLATSHGYAPEPKSSSSEDYYTRYHHPEGHSLDVDKDEPREWVHQNAHGKQSGARTFVSGAGHGSLKGHLGKVHGA
jgi:hypothetical protein